MLLTVRKVPSQAQATQKKDDKYFAWMNPNNRDNLYVVLRNGRIVKIYNIGYDSSISTDEIAINTPMRRELDISLGQMIEVEFLEVDN
jgi:hypothetical protein